MAKPSFLLLPEPQTRFIADWTPGRAAAAIRSLANGNWSQAGSLADAVLGDDRASSVLGTRVNGVTGLPLSFQPALEDHSRAAEIAGTLETDWWQAIPEATLAELHRYGLLCGAVAAQLHWTDYQGRVVPRLEVWHPSHLSLREGRWFVRTTSGEQQIQPGDGQWLIYTPYGNRKPWVGALVRALSIPWLSKQYGVRDWNRYSEVLGGTIRQGNIPSSVKPEDRASFIDDIRRMGSDGILLLPDGYSLELVEASGQSTDNFEKLISWADKALSIAVLGQNLTTDVEGGSRAAATVHDQVRQDLIDADVKSLSTQLHAQVITWWAEFNFGDRNLAPWPEWMSRPAGAKQEISHFILQAPVVTKNEVRESLGLPPVPPEEGGEEFVVIEQGGPLATGLLSRTAEPNEATLKEDERTRTASTSPGFIRGQLWVDNLADTTAQRVTEARQGFRGTVLSAISSARDYDELRHNLLSLYEDSSPQAFAEVLEKALLLADFAGRTAVVEDS